MTWSSCRSWTGQQLPGRLPFSRLRPPDDPPSDEGYTFECTECGRVDEYPWSGGAKEAGWGWDDEGNDLVCPGCFSPDSPQPAPDDDTPWLDEDELTPFQLSQLRRADQLGLSREAVWNEAGGTAGASGPNLMGAVDRLSSAEIGKHTVEPTSSPPALSPAVTPTKTLEPSRKSTTLRPGDERKAAEAAPQKLKITEYAKERRVPDRRRKDGYKLEPFPLHQVETESGEIVFKEFLDGYNSGYLAGPGLAGMTEIPADDDEYAIPPGLTFVEESTQSALEAFVAGWEAALAYSGADSPFPAGGAR